MAYLKRSQRNHDVTSQSKNVAVSVLVHLLAGHEFAGADSVADDALSCSSDEPKWRMACCAAVIAPAGPLA